MLGVVEGIHPSTDALEGASAAIERQPSNAKRLSRISLKTIYTFSESPGAASDGMLRALGFGCCASAPFDVFFVFLDAVLRAAFWHFGTRSLA